MWSSIPSSWPSASCASPIWSAANASSPRPIVGSAGGLIGRSLGPSSKRSPRAQRWRAGSCGSEAARPSSPHRALQRQRHVVLQPARRQREIIFAQQLPAFECGQREGQVVGYVPAVVAGTPYPLVAVSAHKTVL